MSFGKVNFDCFIVDYMGFQNLAERVNSVCLNSGWGHRKSVRITVDK